MSGFSNKKEALQSMASYLAGSADAAGLTDTLDGMGVDTFALTDAEWRRAEWAMEEVCRRLRKMGGA